MPVWRSPLRHWARLALTLAEARAGSNMAARMAIMAMTTSNSMRVKPPLLAGKPPVPAELNCAFFMGERLLVDELNARRVGEDVFFAGRSRRNCNTRRGRKFFKTIGRSLMADNPADEVPVQFSEVGLAILLGGGLRRVLDWLRSLLSGLGGCGGRWGSCLLSGFFATTARTQSHEKCQS